MKILKLKVVPNARKNRIIEENGRLKVWVSAPAVDGKANSVLIEYLAEYFKAKKRDIRIVSGSTSREKTVEIR